MTHILKGYIYSPLLNLIAVENYFYVLSYYKSVLARLKTIIFPSKILFSFDIFYKVLVQILHRIVFFSKTCSVTTKVTTTQAHVKFTISTYKSTKQMS